MSRHEPLGREPTADSGMLAGWTAGGRAVSAPTGDSEYTLRPIGGDRVTALIKTTEVIVAKA